MEGEWMSLRKRDRRHKIISIETCVLYCYLYVGERKIKIIIIN